MKDTSVAEDDSHLQLSHEDAGSLASGTEVDRQLPPEEEKRRLAEWLAKKETTALRRLRGLMLVVLIILTTAACVAVFLYTRGNEEQVFEDEFQSQGLKVVSGFQGDSFRKLETLNSLSTSLTNIALEDEDAEWPFVTIPNSAHHFQSYLSLMNAAAINLLPIVQARQRTKWEKYSIANQDWIVQDLAVANERRLKKQHSKSRDLQISRDNLQDPREVSWYIKNYNGIDTSPGPWLVGWQYAPVIENRWFINFNRLAVPGFEDEVKPVQNDRKAVLSRTWNFATGLDFQSTRDNEYTQELFEAGGNEDYIPGEPIGYIHYPVFDTFDKVKRQTVAVLTATVYWRSYFQNILPDSVRGVLCVVENSLGQSFTYQINGKEAVFLGMEDLHDKRYDDKEIMAEYSAFSDGEDSQRGELYKGVPVDDKHISYHIRIYPSQEFENEHVTNAPFLYMAAIGGCFLVTAFIFVVYDCYSERRQSIVMASAEKTNAVVSELFPEKIRERLMNQTDEIEKAGTENKSKEARFMMDQDESERNILQPSRPIADFFEETSILFADLKGFTQWSSSRTPEEVFELLETIYGAFDRIAKSRRVFKIETIGDCYVAATGLPNPQKDHAVMLCRFAHECLAKVNQLVAELAETLGEDTRDLQLRVGIHSGSVTGGVLRGDKGRFQLFGDSMNTASRMESTGIPGRTQVSKSTADILISRGKRYWLTAREDVVDVKGKGLMQTYFVNPGLAFSTTSGRLSSSVSNDMYDGTTDESTQRDEHVDVGEVSPNLDPFAAEIDTVEKQLNERLRKNESSLSSL